MKNLVLKTNDDYTLIAKYDEGKLEVFEYVVAYEYNGTDWSSGHYFDGIDKALRVFNEVAY